MPEESVSQTDTAPSVVTPAPPPPAPAAPAVAPVSAGPAPVPYSAFKKSNDRAVAAEAALATAQAQATAGTGYQARVTELEAAQATSAARHTVELGLARSGAQDSYQAYLADRYQALPAEGRPTVSDWVEGLKATESAFFGVPAVAATATPIEPAVVPTPAPPTTSPDAAAEPSTTVPQHKPLSEAVIRSMDMDEYGLRRDEIAAWRNTKH